MTANAEFAIQDARVDGISLWQFADHKGNENASCVCELYGPGFEPSNLSHAWDCLQVNSTCHRPKGENNKGAVDMWRRPKRAFAAAKAAFRGPR